MADPAGDDLARLDARRVRELLGLEPHPTCGYVAMSYVSTQRVAPGGLPAPFEGGRPAGSALTFLVTPEAPVRLHRIRNDQLYHFHLGDPLEVLALYPDGSHALHVVGGDIAAGQALHLFLPGATFHTARLVSGGSWFLGASTDGPGSSRPTSRPATPTCVCHDFPDAADQLRAFLLS